MVQQNWHDLHKPYDYKRYLSGIEKAPTGNFRGGKNVLRDAGKIEKVANT